MLAKADQGVSDRTAGLFQALLPFCPGAALYHLLHAARIHGSAQQIALDHIATEAA